MYDTFPLYLLFFFFQLLFEVGNPAFMSDASKELTLRVHDECMYLFFLTGMDDLFFANFFFALTQATVPTSLVRIFALASRTLHMPWKSV